MHYKGKDTNETLLAILRTGHFFPSLMELTPSCIHACYGHAFRLVIGIHHVNSTT